MPSTRYSCMHRLIYYMFSGMTLRYLLCTASMCCTRSCMASIQYLLIRIWRPISHSLVHDINLVLAILNGIERAHTRLCMTLGLYLLMYDICRIGTCTCMASTSLTSGAEPVLAHAYQQQHQQRICCIPSLSYNVLASPNIKSLHTTNNIPRIQAMALIS